MLAVLGNNWWKYSKIEKERKRRWRSEIFCQVEEMREQMHFVSEAVFNRVVTWWFMQFLWVPRQFDHCKHHLFCKLFFATRGLKLPMFLKLESSIKEHKELVLCNRSKKTEKFIRKFLQCLCKISANVSLGEGVVNIGGMSSLH